MLLTAGLCWQLFVARLILQVDVFTKNQWEAGQAVAVQILTVHIHAGDLVVFVGGIVVDSFGYIAF